MIQTKTFHHTVLLALSVTSVLVGCGRDRQPAGQVPRGADSLYTAQAAMMIYGTEPERALRMIDTALLVGKVNPFLADFLRAKVYANSEEASQLDKAIALGESPPFEELDHEGFLRIVEEKARELGADAIVDFKSSLKKDVTGRPTRFTASGFCILRD